ncbi:MAG: CxxC-x17-CxxC domain-containing protein [Candidatus Colwellbacteria bacterium]
MNGNDEGDRPSPREKVQGEWTCSECGTAITELPFSPTEGRPIYCVNCYRNRPRK